MTGHRLRLTSLLAVLALLLVACPKPRPQPMPPAPPDGQNGQEGQNGVVPPPDDPDPPPPAPQEGSLDSLVQEQVGDFQLADAARDPRFIANLGAADALVLVYQNSAGEQVTHRLSAFATAEEGFNAQVALTRVIVEELGFTLLAEEPVTTAEGEQVGTIVGLENDEGTQLLIWLNQRLLASAESSTPGLALEFYQSLPY